MRRIGPSVIFALVLLSVVPALAQAPAECLVPPGPGQSPPYTTGVLKGQRMIQSAWKARNVGESCDNVDLFANAVQRVLATMAAREAQNDAPTVRSACELAGWIQGAQDEADAILGTCADTCFLEGRFMGELAAIAYCELSILLGGLGLDELIIRGPVEVCGVAFEVGCDSEFLSRAQVYRNDFGSCAEYTSQPHRQVFLQTQHNQCAYDPIDPDDPNP